MILDHADRLRQNVNVLSYDKWPSKLNARTNCLAFQLGLAIDLGKDYLEFGALLSPDSEINVSSLCLAYEHLLTHLNFEWRKISCVDDAKIDENIFQIYGPFSNERYPFYDFHVIRRELDGTWVHKPSFGIHPEIIEWKWFSILYPSTSIAGTYAVKKKTP